MLRKIVLVRSHEWLHESWATRSFAAAGMGLQSNVKVKGVEFEEAVYPVPVYSRVERGGTTARIAAAAPAAPVKPPHESYAVVAQFEDEEAIERLKQERSDDVAGVFSDPPIQAAPASYCRTGPEGT